jgi:hypothetical protein
LKAALLDFTGKTKTATPEEFKKQYDAMLGNIQNTIGLMEPTPIVSLSAEAVLERFAADAQKKQA